MWEVRSTGEFDRWFADQPPADQERITDALIRLKQEGPMLGRPHADTLNGSRHPNMKELRPVIPRRAVRIAFAFDPQRKGIVLLAGDKAGISSDRFYRNLIRRADALYDEHLRAISEESS